MKPYAACVCVSLSVPFTIMNYEQCLAFSAMTTIEQLSQLTHILFWQLY
jgi:hypothetical protein